MVDFFFIIIFLLLTIPSSIPEMRTTPAISFSLFSEMENVKKKKE